MNPSDKILARLLTLHPKIIDLSLDRMHRLLARLGNPHLRLPPAIHVAGTNGKGSTVATIRSILEAAGLAVHCYTSPHLVHFRERIRLSGQLIADGHLTGLLEECETANGGEPITFFEITTAAAFLAFSRIAADYAVLEVGLGGRLDATNVIEPPAVSVITMIDYDHQQYLGDTLAKIAREKAGILKRGVTGIIAEQAHEALAEIEAVGRRAGSPLMIANQDWHCIEQQGRLVYHDDDGLLDLPLPQLPGRHQIGNAGNAIAAVRALADRRVGEPAFAEGLRKTEWPARLQRLGPGALQGQLASDAELWLDGGHNPSAGNVLAQALSDLNDRYSRPLVLVWGMLNTKDARAFISPFAGIAHRVVALKIPDEDHALPAEDLAQAARAAGLNAETADSIEAALRQASNTLPTPRILICGSLYLAGHVLALHANEKPSGITGLARR